MIVPETNVNLATHVRDALIAGGGSVTNDTTSFFKSEAKINRWSKRKPFNKAVTFTDEWDSGFVVTPSGGDLYYLEYILPTGGEYSPYRLGDFRGYDSDAPAPSLSMTEVAYNYAYPSPEANIEINNVKSLIKKISEENVSYNIDSVKVVGYEDHARQIYYDGSSDSVYVTDSSYFHPSITAAKNPGATFSDTESVAFTSSNYPERNFKFKGLALDFKVTSKFPLAYDLTNPWSMQTFQGACIQMCQENILGSNAVFGSMHSVLTDDDIRLSWYSFTSSGIYINLSLYKNERLTELVENNIYASGAMGDYRVILYRGRAQGVSGHVYPYDIISGADAVVTKTYIENYQGTNYYLSNDANEWIRGFPYLQLQIFFSDAPSVYPTVEEPHLVCGIVNLGYGESGSVTPVSSD